MKVSYILGIFAFLGICSDLVRADAGPSCVIADNAFVVAQEIRGLKKQHDVPCEMHSRDQIEAFIKENIDTKLPANKLHMEGLVYKTVGLLPEKYDYVNGVVQLYLSQIGGYYDPDRKHFIMADWMPGILQTTVAVHELTHALQDQYFNLGKIIDPQVDNGDEQSAHSALVEGDATAVMIDYTRKLMGQAPLSTEKGIESTIFQQVMGGGIGLGSDDTPESLKMMLLFPYTSGLRFCHSLLSHGGYAAVNKAFKRLPRSTEEILHPEIYIQDKLDYVTFDPQEIAKDPIVIETTGVPDPKVKYKDVLGEFSVSLMIGELLKDKTRAADTARGWGGDLVTVFEGAHGGGLLVWTTNWDTAADAQEFLTAYRQGLSKKFKKDLSGNGWLPASLQMDVRIEASGNKVVSYFKLAKI